MEADDLALFKRGTALQRGKQYERCAEIFHKLILKYPDNPDLNYAYGTTLSQIGWDGSATVYLKKAIALTGGKHASAMINLGSTYRSLGDVERARDMYATACQVAIKQQMEPSIITDAYSNVSAIYHALGRNEEACEAARSCLAINPAHAIAHWNLSIASLTLGDWKTGWDEYDWGYRADERKRSVHVDRFPEWWDQNLKGKSILVWGEQGLGDEILFVQYLEPLAREAHRVIYDCHPRLGTIFKRSFPDIEIQPRRKGVGAWALADKVDYHVPVGSLPRIFGKDGPSGAPYLIPEPSRKDFWDRQIPGDIRVGLSWRGGKGDHGSRFRSMQLERLAPLIVPFKDEQRIQFVSLQYGRHLDEVMHFNAVHGTDVWHSDYANEDLDEQLSVTANCDLVISVITTIVHSAGALGVPTWCLCPIGSPWKFSFGEDQNRWHASVRQYWQTERLHWSDVIKRVRTDFEKWADKQLLLPPSATISTRPTGNDSSNRSIDSGPLM